MNEAFHAPHFYALSDFPYVGASVTLPVLSELVRGPEPESVATLVDIDIFDTGLDDVVTQRFADRGLIYPDDTAYAERLKTRVEVSQSGFDSIGVGGRVAITLSLVELFNEDLVFDEAIEQGLALGRTAVIKTMPAPDQAASDCGGGDLADAAIVFTGIVAAMAASRGGMELTLSDLGERLNTPLQAELYAGTGGLEGGNDLAGAPKPVTLGSVFNATPVYIGLVDLGDGSLPTYQSSWRQIRGHTVVRERGVAMTRVTSAPGVGQWRDWPVQGCFQLGFTPNGIITCDVKGDSPPVVAPVTVELTWWQSTFEQGLNDQAAMGLAFYDSLSNQLGSDLFSTLIDTPSSGWTQRSLSTTAPVGTTTIRLYQKMHRRVGFNDDGYIDDIVLSVGGVPQTVVNPGAETGDTTGWTSTLGTLTVRNASPSPHGGSWYFMGGTDGSPDTLAHQDIAVSEVLAPVAGGYAATTATVIKRMLTGLGPQFTLLELDSDSFDSLDLRLPGEIGWRQGAEPVQAVDALEQVLSHCGVWLSGGRDGKLRVSTPDRY